MKNKFVISIAAAATIAAAGCRRAGEAATTFIPQDVMADKVRGAWAGKMIGVMYGRPMEFQATDHIYTDSVAWTPEMIAGALNEDDIYGQMNFMMTMERLGQQAPIDSLARAFAEAEFPLCHANLQTRKNYFDGVPAAELALPARSIHCEDIDFQIECDFIGFVNPGMPRAATAMCERVGRIMAAADGLYAGVYVSTMHSLAFVDGDIPSIVKRALGSIPAESGYARCIADVIARWEADPADWRGCWQMLADRWAARDICTPYHAFNIDAKLNGAYVVMGLLYGGGDWRQTMDITVACGQDTDCNTATAAALLGLIDGYEAIPEIYRSHLPAIADETFLFTTYSYNKAVERTLECIAENVAAGGGRVTAEGYDIATQQPEPMPMEPGHDGLVMKEQVKVTDTSRWRFDGAWTDFVYGAGDNDLYRVATQPGDSASISFEGTGIALLGSWNTDGGRALIVLDGAEVDTVDTYYVTEAGKYEGNRAYLYFTTGLPDGTHTLTLVNLEEASPRSSARKIYLERALIYD